MDNRAPSLLPAVRVVEGQVFKPDVGLFGALAITMRVDIIPSIETTCVRLGGDIENIPKLEAVAVGYWRPICLSNASCIPESASCPCLVLSCACFLPAL